MKDPKRDVVTMREGASYFVPTYHVTNDGLKDGNGAVIEFCKGNKDNIVDFRQEGFFTETLIQVAKQYLEDVNKGELQSRDTSIAITKLDEALLWIGKRAEDRKARNVQGTYQK